MHAHVRVELVHRRPIAIGSAQLVDDRILDLQRAEVGVVDARTLAAELHRQAASRQQVIVPVDIQHAVIQVFGILHREARQHQQHTVGQTRPQAQAVSRLQIGNPTDRRGLLAHFLQPEPGGLFCKQPFQPFGASEKKFVTIRHVGFQCLRQFNRVRKPYAQQKNK